jgi:ubiquinone biosynthesis protein UbiJ
MLGHALLAAVEKGLNRMLALDGAAHARLARLEGKVIAVQSRAPDVTLHLLPHAEGLRLAGRWEAPADCTLRAPAGELLRLALARDKTAVLHGPAVALEGDTAALTELTAILQDLDLDWEYELSRWLGPVGARLVGSPLRSGLRWSRQSLDSLRQDLADYLAEESRQLVGRQEAEARFSEIDELRLALDRLDARIARLAQGPKTPQ